MSTPSFGAGDTLGNYRLIEEINRGSQGVVFRAHDEQVDRDVALKILAPTLLADEAARKRFRQEARALGRLNHPNVAIAYHFDEKPVDFLVTEFVSGHGLDEMLADGPLAEESVLQLGTELASGLAAAHREGIIHRDLKPGNLRVTDSGQLKILDFGLAELVDPGTDIALAETVSLSMTLTGTLPYMAPEQFNGVFDQRTDLWAAGVVLFEMATGKLPFPQNTLHSLKEAILRSEPKRPTDINPAISPGLEQVILRALKKDPKLRYQTAKDLHDDLVRVAAGRKIKQESWLGTQNRKLATAALLIAAGALIAYFLIKPPPPPPGGKGFKVLAVLPLEASGQDAAENALGRGVAETVSARIAQASNGRQIQLIPPSESTGKGVSNPESARREFGAEMVLMVGLQRSGEKMRVTCSLIDPRTHQQVDARTVTGDASDLFALEDTAVAGVFEMLPRNAKSEQATIAEVHAATPPGYEYYLRGRGYLLEYQKPENVESAIAEFQHAIQIDPDYPPAYAGLGQAYWVGYQQFNKGKLWLQKASDNCARSLALNPKLAEAHTCLGNFYYGTGKYTEAIEQYQRALDINPESDYALGQLADAYQKLSNPAAAEAAYKKAIEIRPDYWGLYSGLGAIYASQARYSNAAEMFQKAIQLSPENYLGYSNLGGIYVYQGRYEEAISTSAKSIELRPNLNAYNNLGAAYFYLHRFPAAEKTFQQASKLDERDWLVKGNIGDALYWIPERRAESARAYGDAIRLAKSQLDINPSDASVLAFLADYYAMTEKKGDAIATIQKALGTAPRDPEVMFRAAIVYNHFGDIGKCIYWLDKALAAGYSLQQVKDTPDFEVLAKDPRFLNLIKVSSSEKH